MKRFILSNIILLFFLTSFSFGQGSAYCGPYRFSKPIVWHNIHKRTISGKKITNSLGHCIQLSNCSDIIIQNCKLTHAKGQGINLYKCSNITVINCSIDSVATGIYAGACSQVKIKNNDVKNVFGPMPRGQMVQFDQVNGGDNCINYNAFENISGQSYPEDAISLFMSNGIEGNPIQVIGNWIRGGGPSTSGGGIMTGDKGGSYIIVQDNILVNPGQYGITIASGHHISIKKNKIFAEQKPFNSVGLSAYKQYPIDCYSDTVMNNEVNYKFKDGSPNNFLHKGDFGEVIGWGTNIYNPNLNSSILPPKIIGNCR